MRGKFKYYKIVTVQQNVTKNAQDIKSTAGTWSRPSRITLISTKVNNNKCMRLKP